MNTHQTNDTQIRREYVHTHLDKTYECFLRKNGSCVLTFLSRRIPPACVTLIQDTIVLTDGVAMDTIWNVKNFLKKSKTLGAMRKLLCHRQKVFHRSPVLQRKLTTVKAEETLTAFSSL